MILLNGKTLNEIVYKLSFRKNIYNIYGDVSKFENNEKVGNFFEVSIILSEDKQVLFL